MHALEFSPTRVEIQLSLPLPQNKAFLQVRTGVVPSANLSRETYMKAIVPIGGLFAITLWLSNAAYLYLSVSFIQVILSHKICTTFTWRQQNRMKSRLEGTKGRRIAVKTFLKIKLQCQCNKIRGCGCCCRC